VAAFEGEDEPADQAVAGSDGTDGAHGGRTDPDRRPQGSHEQGSLSGKRDQHGVVRTDAEKPAGGVDDLRVGRQLMAGMDAQLVEARFEQVDTGQRRLTEGRTGGVDHHPSPLLTRHPGHRRQLGRLDPTRQRATQDDDRLWREGAQHRQDTALQLSL
jgi:hypothetical protein